MNRNTGYNGGFARFGHLAEFKDGFVFGKLVIN